MSWIMLLVVWMLSLWCISGVVAVLVLKRKAESFREALIRICNGDCWPLVDVATHITKRMEEESMTPLKIEILLHYNTRPGDYRGGDFSAPAVMSAIDSFLRKEIGLLQPTSNEQISTSYELTERGKVYIAALLAMPLPVCRWVMPSHHASENERMAEIAEAMGKRA